MKKLVLLLTLIGATTIYAETPTADAEAFLPGRIESRALSRTILAKCSMRDVLKACIGYQFFYSETGNEADAKLISDRTYTQHSLKKLMENPIIFNATREDREGLNVVHYIEFLNDYDDSWGDSIFARISYAVGRGFCYAVVTPILAASDILGITLAAPRTIIQVSTDTLRNTKIIKLIRAIETGRKLPMNIDRLERLHNLLHDGELL